MLGEGLKLFWATINPSQHDFQTLGLTFKTFSIFGVESIETKNLKAGKSINFSLGALLVLMVISEVA